MTGGSIYILQREGPSHIHLYTIYMGRWYTVVLEEKLRKYGLEFKEVKSTTRIWLSPIHVYATISIVLMNSVSSNLLFAFYIVEFKCLQEQGNNPLTRRDTRKDVKTV